MDFGMLMGLIGFLIAIIALVVASEGLKRLARKVEDKTSEIEVQVSRNAHEIYELSKAVSDVPMRPTADRAVTNGR